MRQWRSLVTKRALSLSTEAQVMVGIDEAGRGPALGPMVYSAVYYSIDREEEMNGLGFQDSKTLVHDARSTLFQKIHDSQSIGFPSSLINLNPISLVSIAIQRVSYRLWKYRIKCSVRSGISMRLRVTQRCKSSIQYLTKTTPSRTCMWIHWVSQKRISAISSSTFIFQFDSEWRKKPTVCFRS